MVSQILDSKMLFPILEGDEKNYEYSGQGKVKYQQYQYHFTKMKFYCEIGVKIKNPGVTWCYKKCITQKCNKKNLKKFENAKRP